MIHHKLNFVSPAHMAFFPLVQMWKWFQMISIIINLRITFPEL